MQKQPTLISRFTTPVNPDCIKVSPFNPSIFCIGHYHQIEGENTEGAISILSSKNKANLQISSVETAAVLHLCWINTLINNRKFVVAACRNSCLKIFEYSEQNGKLTENKTIEIQDKQLYCLYVDCVVNDNKINVVVSTNVKKTIFFVLDFEFNVEEQFEFEDHEYAVWCCRINPFAPNSFLSGDEISSLILYDIRSNPLKVQKNSKIHENGVSDIVFTNKEHEFLTGTFDGCVRCFDVRNINKVVREYRTEGVIWRIVGNQSWDQALLCRSSVNTFSILSLAEEFSQRVQIKEHQSLAYAADWNDQTIVTASFYDKLICVWEK